MKGPKQDMPQGSSQKWLVLVLVSLGNFVATLDTGIINLSFPILTDVFNTDPNTVLWVSAAYYLTIVGLMQPFGKLADTIAPKKVFAWGFILFTLGLTLCAVAQNIGQLIAFRVVQAVGVAMIFAVSNAILTSVFPPEERGKAMGIASGVVGAGLAVGPALGGLMLNELGWRSIFYLRSPIGLAGIIMSFLVLKSGRIPRANRSFDFLGALLLFVAMASLLLAINRGRILGWSSATIIGLFITATVLLIIFIVLEKRVANPVVNLGLFRSRNFTAANWGNLLRFIAISANNFLTPFYLIGVTGFTPVKAGLILTAVPVVILLVAPAAGWLSDKIGSRLLCSAGMVSICLGLFFLSRLDANSSIVAIVPILVLMGLGSGLFESPNHSAVMGAVPRDYLGTASAMIATFRATGQSLGLAIAGIVFVSREAYYASTLTSQGTDPQLVAGLAYHGGIADGFLVGMTVGIAALVVSLLLKRDQTVS
ncbi:DHA2 family efflux MFS transporter permease subunit [Chloroflexota bacterium]